MRKPFGPITRLSWTINLQGWRRMIQGITLRQAGSGACCAVLTLTAFSILPAIGKVILASDDTPSISKFLTLRNQAVNDIRAGRGAEALPAYLKLVEENPTGGTLWLGLAHSHIQTDQATAAIPALEKSLELGVGKVAGPGFRQRVHVGFARRHAHLNDTNEMYAALDDALASRLTDRAQLIREPDFGRFLEDPRFKQRMGLAGADVSCLVGWRLDLDVYEEGVNCMFAPTSR